MNDKRSPALGFIFVTLLIDVIGLGIIIPVMPKLISELTGDSISAASRDGGWLLFAYASMQFLCAPIIGGISDRFGRRPVLLASLFGFGIDYIFLAFAPTLAWLYVGRIIAGIMGASFTTGAAYIADISTPEKRAQNFGLLGAAFGLARHQRQSSDAAGLRPLLDCRTHTQPVFVLWRDVGLVAVADFFVCAHGDECHRWHART